MKKHLSWILVIALVLAVVFVFVACGKNDNNNGGNQGGGDAGTTIGGDYNFADINAKLQQLANGQGFYIRYAVQFTDGGEQESATVVMAMDHDKYYYSADGEEGYIDLSGADGGVIYSKENGVWTSTSVAYALMSRDDLRSMASQAMTYMAMYQAYASLPATKTTATVAGRACDKFVVDTVVAGAAAHVEICIDKATNVCLKVLASGVAGGQSGSASFECQEFRIPYTINLPDVGSQGGGEDNPPAGHTHTLVQVPRVEPTASTDGHLAYWTCSGCNKYFSDEGGRNEITNLAAWLQGDGKLAATGGGDNPPAGHTHTLVETPRVNATETQDGHLAYWTCSGCNRYFSDAEGRNEIVNLNSWLAGAGRLPATGGQTSDGPVRVVAEYIGGEKRVGDTLLPSEIQVMAYYANGNFVLVDNFELCYFDNETAGEVEVEIDVTIDGTNWCPSVTITVLPAEGEDPNEFVTIREEYIGSAVTHDIVSFFEGGLMVEYAYSGRNALTLQGSVDVDVLVAIKGNLGYFKNVLTGNSEYVEFGQDSYTVYAYNSNIGDYERDGYPISYNTIEEGMKRDDAIMYLLFGLGTQEVLSTDWANSSDMWTSCAIRYGRRGVDNCLFRKEEITLTFGAERRVCDRYYFAEDVTEAHEHTNGYYITIDRETEMMVEWHRDSDPIETKMFSTNFTLTLFEHIGFNPGDDNDDTTVIASYPYITDDNIVAGLIRRGVQGTFRATRDQSRNDPATSGEEVSFHVYGNLYAYAGLVDGQPVVGYIDASFDDYYLRYYEIADGWTATKCYYSDYYAGGADFSSKSVLESELLSMLYRCLVLDERAAHISGMTKTREQFLGRTVDKFEVNKNYETFVIRVDVETGACIYYTDVYEAQAGTTLTYDDCFVATAFAVDVPVVLPEIAEIYDPHNPGGDPGHGGDEPTGKGSILQDFPEIMSESYMDDLFESGISFSFSVTYGSNCMEGDFAILGDLYLLSDDGMPMYFDLSPEGGYVKYEMDGEDGWLANFHLYGEVDGFASREDLEGELRSLIRRTVLLNLSAETVSMEFDRDAEADFQDRAAIRFSQFGEGDYAFNYDIYMDVELGLPLSASISLVTADGALGTVTEISNISLEPRIVLPEAEINYPAMPMSQEQWAALFEGLDNCRVSVESGVDWYPEHLTFISNEEFQYLYEEENIGVINILTLPTDGTALECYYYSPSDERWYHSFRAADGPAPYSLDMFNWSFWIPDLTENYGGFEMIEDGMVYRYFVEESGNMLLSFCYNNDVDAPAVDAQEITIYLDYDGQLIGLEVRTFDELCIGFSFEYDEFEPEYPNLAETTTISEYYDGIEELGMTILGRLEGYFTSGDGFAARYYACDDGVEMEIGVEFGPSGARSYVYTDGELTACIILQFVDGGIVRYDLAFEEEEDVYELEGYLYTRAFIDANDEEYPAEMVLVDLFAQLLELGGGYESFLNEECYAEADSTDFNNVHYDVTTFTFVGEEWSLTIMDDTLLIVSGSRGEDELSLFMFGEFDGSSIKFPEGDAGTTICLYYDGLEDPFPAVADSLEALMEESSYQIYYEWSDEDAHGFDLIVTPDAISAWRKDNNEYTNWTIFVRTEDGVERYDMDEEGDYLNAYGVRFTRALLPAEESGVEDFLGGCMEMIAEIASYYSDYVFEPCNPSPYEAEYSAGSFAATEFVATDESWSAIIMDESKMLLCFDNDEDFHVQLSILAIGENVDPIFVPELDEIEINEDVWGAAFAQETVCVALEYETENWHPIALTFVTNEEMSYLMIEYSTEEIDIVYHPFDEEMGDEYRGYYYYDPEMGWTGGLAADYYPMEILAFNYWVPDFSNDFERFESYEDGLLFTWQAADEGEWVIQWADFFAVPEAWQTLDCSQILVNFDEEGRLAAMTLATFDGKMLGFYFGYDEVEAFIPEL